MGKKHIWEQPDGACLLVLQGESGLEGDSGPPGPDGVKVNFTLVSFQLSHTSPCTHAPVVPGTTLKPRELLGPLCNKPLPCSL